MECTVKEIDDQTAFEIALMENIQRKEFDPFEEGKAYQKYVMEYGWGSVTELAQKIGKSPQLVSARISLLNLPKDHFRDIRDSKLNVSQATELASLDTEKAGQLADRIIDIGLNKAPRDVLRGVVNLVKQGLPVDQATTIGLEQPEYAVWAGTQAHARVNPQEMAREQIELTLSKALKGIDDQLAYIPEGEENQKWVAFVRFPLHELVDNAKNIRTGKPLKKFEFVTTKVQKSNEQ